ncbi:MAG: serine hydrolase [Gammaproteobacteria bacterium]|nr:serine hydrolase [Gammaproteobacteria bacterium]
MMIIKRILIGLVTLCVLLILSAYATGHGYLVTAMQRTYLQGNNTANINDHTAFRVNRIETANPMTLPRSAAYNQRALPDDFRAELEKYKTAAFLVVQDGEVLTEHYMNGYHDRSKTNSFSMAKTVTTMLLGIAIEEGYIKSLEQPLTDFLPEFKQDPLGNKANIGQLSLMNSGYEWVEHYYSALSPTVELLYGPDVEDFLLKGHFSAEPGSFWEYSSASTQLLGIVLKRALHRGGKQVTLAEYLSEKIWQPLQMNDDALWHTDDTGLEFSYCCLNTNARNFARLGMLMLNNGNWQGRQVVPARFIQTMIQPVGTAYYGYSTWLGLEAKPAYYHFSGHLGQYIIVIPEYNMVVVRLGETRDNNRDFRLEELPVYVQQALALAGK